MKKKFTMLFAALLAFVGVAKAQVTSLEQLSNDTKYVLASTRCFFIVDNEGTVLQTSNRTAGATFDANDANQQFQIINNEGTYYLFSVGASKYVNKDGSLSETATDALTLTDESESRPNYPWKMCIGGNGLNTQIPGQAANGIMINGWTTADDGNCFAIRNVEEYTLSTEYYYQIRNVAHSRMLAANATNATSISTNSTADLNQLWAFEQGENGTFYLRNAGQEKYLVAIAENNKAWTVAEEDGTAFNVKVQNPGILSYYLHNAAESDLINCAHDANWGTDVQVVRWYASAEASQWYLEKTNILATATEISFTYSFVYEGVEKYSQDCIAIVGEEYPAITAVFPFGVSAVKPEGKVTDDKDGDKVTIDLSVNLPFTYSEDYESIENWYFLNIRDDGPTYMYYDENVDFIKATETSVPAESKDAYTWAFIGDPFTGFSIVNYEAGATMVLSAPVAPTGNQHTEALARMVAKENIAEGNETWDFVKPTHANAASGAFYVQHPTAESYAFNRQGLNGTNTVCYWTGRDTGSALQVVKRDDSEQLRQLVASAQEYLVNLGAGTSVGCVTADSKTAINNAIAAANTAIENKTGYNEAQAALQAAIAAVKTIQPEEGKFYTLKNSYSSIYANVNSNGGMISTNAVGMGEIFQFVPAEDGFYLKNVERGTYLSTNKQHGYGQEETKATTTDDAVVVTIKNLGAENHVSITPNGGATIHHDAGQSKIVAWNGGLNSRSSWLIEEVVDITTYSHVVKTTDVKWATLVLGYDAIIPDGVTAYAVTEAGNNVATLTEITGTIPAFEAVLLNAEAGSYDFKYAESAEAVEGNMLKGSTINENVEGLGYVLAAKEGNVGLYKAALNVSTNTENDGTKEEPAVTYEAFLNNAFKAYLPVAEGAEAPAMFTLGRGGEDEDATGIDQLINANGEVVIYDLAGRRVEKMEKGIYIVNGKKVIR